MTHGQVGQNTDRTVVSCGSPYSPGWSRQHRSPRWTTYGTIKRLDNGTPRPGDSLDVMQGTQRSSLAKGPVGPVFVVVLLELT
ncbi:hypothetical protein ABT009_28460 [Streptomyces sp. NPDC002896]|uniref:hypothetical protein n=1 Tax=Streptomyces sp. NPDC002896 TaxID=3154438 RepID=UPI00332095EC